MTVSDSTLAADGVAGLAVFVDNGASALINNSTLVSSGGTLYADYVNSPAQETMVAPPWILGIMGTSRTSNLMGTNSTMTVVNSTAKASNWAVLSTDSGSNMVLNAVNSTLELTGTDTTMQADGKFDTTNPYTNLTGYGTYVIGDAEETFLGTTFNVGTYATIFTGGSAYYGNLKSGETYTLKKADGSTHTTYQATEDKNTVINSDTFGFMAHKNTNNVVLDGIEVNSEFTDFLVKSGCDNTIVIKNGTTLNAANGILLQLMDNDDSTTEFDKELTVFGETHEEYAGFPIAAVEKSAGSNTTTYSIEDCDLVGSIFNGIGWDANDLSNGNVAQMSLKVNMSGTSTLTGAIASTSCIHATYDGQTYLKSNNISAFDDAVKAAEFAEKYQTTLFSQSEYFNIGQVANLVMSNGLNLIDVTLADDAVWTVDSTSLINSLSISGNAKVVVNEGATLTVGEKQYEAGTYTTSDFS